MDVQCPDCKGDGFDAYADGTTCCRCDGDGKIPFEKLDPHERADAKSGSVPVSLEQRVRDLERRVTTLESRRM